MGEADMIGPTGVSVGVGVERFREKTMAFLRDKHPALHKVRWNEPLTVADLQSLEEMLVQAGIGSSAQVGEIAQKRTDSVCFCVPL